MVLSKTQLSSKKIEAEVLPIVSFIGRSNCGKTTFLEKVVKELKLRGYRVGVIKHTPHGFDIDQPRKDTWRLAQAGSNMVAISSPDRLALIERVNKEPTVTQVRELFEDKVDILLTEGYKNEDTDKILILSTKEEEDRPSYKGELLATVYARQSPLGVPRFEYGDVVGIADLLAEKVTSTSSRIVESLSKSDTLASHNHQPDKFEALLAEAAAAHGHICPGQILGVRMAMRGLQELNIEKPKKIKKQLIVYVEIDRCATDAIQIVTGCSLGKRTMKYVDYGKLAATFVDLRSGNAVRLAVREDAREKAALIHPRLTRYEAQLAVYKWMSDEELFTVEPVGMQIPIHDAPGPPLRRVICDRCGEGVNDGREVSVGGQVLCRPCAYGSYHQPCETLVASGVAALE